MSPWRISTCTTSAVSCDSREITNVSASSRVAIRAVASIEARLDALAPVAQGIERAPPERKVAGSIPARRIPRAKAGPPAAGHDAFARLPLLDFVCGESRLSRHSRRCLFLTGSVYRSDTP